MDIEEEIEEIVLRINRLHNGCLGVDCMYCALLKAENGIKRDLCSHLSKLEYNSIEGGN